MCNSGHAAAKFVSKMDESKQKAYSDLGKAYERWKLPRNDALFTLLTAMFPDELVYTHFATIHLLHTGGGRLILKKSCWSYWPLEKPVGGEMVSSLDGRSFSPPTKEMEGLISLIDGMRSLFNSFIAGVPPALKHHRRAYIVYILQDIAADDNISISPRIAPTGIQVLDKKGGLVKHNTPPVVAASINVLIDVINSISEDRIPETVRWDLNKNNSYK